mgnify:CR=1 FL=1
MAEYVLPSGLSIVEAPSAIPLKATKFSAFLFFHVLSVCVPSTESPQIDSMTNCKLGLRRNNSLRHYKTRATVNSDTPAQPLTHKALARSQQTAHSKQQSTTYTESARPPARSSAGRHPREMQRVGDAIVARFRRPVAVRVSVAAVAMSSVG